MVRCSSLLLMLAAAAALTGYASLAPWLEPLPRLLLPAALLWLLWRRGRGGVISSRPALFLAVALFVYFLLAVPRQGLVTSSVGFMASLLALRLVSEKSSRHHLQICALSIFLLAASSIYSLSPLFVLYLCILLLLITLMLLLLTFSHYSADMLLDALLFKKVLAGALLMQACAAPLVVLLFMVLPRTQIPLWRFGAPAETARIGFSESVRPGAVASVASERTPVFRAEMARVGEERLYWRGTVLNRVEGAAWTRVPPPPVHVTDAGRGGRTDQLIQLEQGSGSFLFTLDVPQSVGKLRATLSADGVVQASAPLGSRVRYEVRSVERFSLSEEHPDFYRQLPPAVSPRLLTMAERVRREAPMEADRAALLEREFRQLGLVYDVKGLPTTADPIDTFLFSGKRGNCEFFAASYALLLRSAGIPARLVGGYFGGTYSDLGGYYLVTQDMAHTWVEYYLPGLGWRRIDPTLWGEGSEWVAGGRTRGGLSKIRLYADTLTFLWDSRVIPFDFESQYQVLRQSADMFGSFRRAVASIKPAQLARLLSVSLVVFGSAWWLRHRFGRKHRLERLLRRFEQHLRQQQPSLSTLRQSGLFGLAAESGSASAHRFAMKYGSVIYRDEQLSVSDVEELEQLLKEL